MGAERCDSPRISNSNTEVDLCITKDTQLDCLVDEVSLSSAALLKISSSLKFGIHNWGVRDGIHDGFNVALEGIQSGF